MLGDAILREVMASCRPCLGCEVLSDFAGEAILSTVKTCVISPTLPGWSFSSDLQTDKQKLSPEPCFASNERSRQFVVDFVDNVDCSCRSSAIEEKSLSYRFCNINASLWG